jgi:hypothetical protein
MSVIAEIIDTLENKVDSKNKAFRSKQPRIKIELTKSAYIIQTQSTDIEALKSKYETLKIANSLLGSDDNKRELKINSLIRKLITV